MSLLKLKRGDVVWIRARGQDAPVPALVMLASPNGRSLIVTFDALIGGYLNLMPLYWDDAADQYAALMDDMPVQLEAQS